MKEIGAHEVLITQEGGDWFCTIKIGPFPDATMAEAVGKSLRSSLSGVIKMLASAMEVRL